jgi:hypothetical protein
MLAFVLRFFFVRWFSFTGNAKHFTFYFYFLSWSMEERERLCALETFLLGAGDWPHFPFAEDEICRLLLPTASSTPRPHLLLRLTLLRRLFEVVVCPWAILQMFHFIRD